MLYSAVGKASFFKSVSDKKSSGSTRHNWAKSISEQLLNLLGTHWSKAYSKQGDLLHLESGDPCFHRKDEGIFVMTQQHWRKALPVVLALLRNQILLPQSLSDTSLVHDSWNVCVSFVARSMQCCRHIWKLGFISSELGISSTTSSYLGWKQNLS